MRDGIILYSVELPRIQDALWPPLNPVSWGPALQVDYIVLHCTHWRWNNCILTAELVIEVAFILFWRKGRFGKFKRTSQSERSASQFNLAAPGGGHNVFQVREHLYRHYLVRVRDRSGRALRLSKRRFPARKFVRQIADDILSPRKIRSKWDVHPNAGRDCNFLPTRTPSRPGRIVQKDNLLIYINHRAVISNACKRNRGKF